MQRKIKTLLIPKQLESYLANRALVTDLLCKLVITFGVVLIVGGLYLMITAATTSTQVYQTYVAIKSTVDTVNWIPGIPFYIGDLINSGASAVGLVSWILGVDLILVGLGLWVRHRIARFAAFLFFGLAAMFQFVQFLFFGAFGSPASIIELCIDVVIIYFLFSRFDSATIASKDVSIGEKDIK